MKIKAWPFIFLLIFLSSSGYGQNTIPEYQEKILSNGATVISTYMPGTSLVTIQIRVLSGLSNEGIYAGTGISHFLEHLLFKGTLSKTGEQLRHEIKKIGAIVNGSTGLDSAEYHMIVPVNKFEEAFDLLSDMVMDPVFSEDDIEIERQVIFNEIRLRNDDPMSNMIRKLFGLSYKESVYRYPIIGEQERFAALTREDLMDYHSKVYTTDRIVIGIAGGLTPEITIKAAEEKFSQYERYSEWESPVSKEPAQKRALIAEYPEDITLAYMAIGFHSTGINSKDLFAADVLSLLLGEGEDSRLYKTLVKEKRLLYNVSTINYTPKYPGLFIVTGIGAPDKIQKAREEIFNIISRLKDERIDQGELIRARNLILSKYFHSMERSKDMISSMTESFMLTGDTNFAKNYVDKLRDVDAKEIKDVLSVYLEFENSNTVILLPSYLITEPVVRAEELDTDPEKAKEPAFTEEYTNVLPKEKMKWNKNEQEKLIPDGYMKKTLLGNGLTVIAKKNGYVPLVSVVFSCHGGLRAETKKDNGLSGLTAAVSVKGTDTRAEEQIMPVMEKLGGSLSAFSGKNSLGLVMDILSENHYKGMDIFEDVIKNASFPEKEIKKEKEIVLAMIKEQEKSIFEYGLMNMKKLIYQDHPYGLRILGTERNVKSFTREDMMRFYKDHFSPSGAVLTIVGDIDPDKAISDAESRFGSWKKRKTRIRNQKVSDIKKNSRLDLDMNKEQSLILIGYKGVKLSEELKYPLEILTSLLSGSDGILFDELREKQGLVYASGVLSVPEVDPGYVVFYAATEEANIPKTKSLISEVIQDMNVGKFSVSDIEASKNMLVSRQAYALETNHSLSMICALDELYGLGYDDYRKYPESIKSVTIKDMDKAVKAIFKRSYPVEVVIHSR